MKIPKQAYTTEFKKLAVKRVKDGQSISTVIKELGLSDQTLHNWLKTSAECRLIRPELQATEKARIAAFIVGFKAFDMIVQRHDFVLQAGENTSD